MSKNVSVHQLRDFILVDPKLTYFDRVLLCVLLMHRNAKNNACFPGKQTLCRELDCSDTHLRNRLKECKRQGFVLWRRSLPSTDYWFPPLGDTGPFERTGPKPKLKKLNPKPNYSAGSKQNYPEDSKPNSSNSRNETAVRVPYKAPNKMVGSIGVNTAPIGRGTGAPKSATGSPSYGDITGHALAGACPPDKDMEDVA